MNSTRKGPRAFPCRHECSNEDPFGYSAVTLGACHDNNGILSNVKGKHASISNYVKGVKLSVTGIRKTCWMTHILDDHRKKTNWIICAGYKSLVRYQTTTLIKTDVLSIQPFKGKRHRNMTQTINISIKSTRANMCSGWYMKACPWALRRISANGFRGATYGSSLGAQWF